MFWKLPVEEYVSYRYFKIAMFMVISIFILFYFFFLQEKVLAMDTHFSKLPNSLIEICVVVGMDQDTGLVAARSAEVI